MTQLNLRMLYKAETGNYPTNQSDYAGWLFRDYAIWLENKSPIDSRLLFKKETGNEAMWFKSEANMYMYTKKYKEWMEEKYCETH